jgi:hypothetical protein
MTRRTLFLALFLCAAARAQTTISDNLNQTVGVMLNGTVEQVKISWAAFHTASGTNVAANSTVVQLPKVGPLIGKFSTTLQPNVGASPATNYSFTFSVLNNTTGQISLYTASVIVPASPATLPLAGCQVSASWWVQDIAESGTSGAPTVSSNAISLNGVALSGTPADGQAYVFSQTANSFIPIAVPVWRKFTVAYNQLTGFASTSGTVVLAPRANRQKVCGVSTYTTAAFAGSGISSIRTTVGDSNSTPDYYTPAPVNLIDNGSQDYNVMGSAVASSNITATFTSAPGNLSALNSGSIDIELCLLAQ